MAIVSHLLFCFCIGLAIGGLICTLCEMIKLLRSLLRSDKKELEYSVLDYTDAEMKLQKYMERALEVYRLLDPDQRLLNGGYVGSFSYMPFTFKKGEKPELMVVLTFECDDESYEKESRQAWFPFELMNSDYISSLNAEDKISIEWTNKSLPYGGGKQWKMVARFDGPIDEKFLNNRMN